MDTFPIFYEDIYDALTKMVNTNPRGLNMKQIACELWPARHPDTARSALSRALNPENHDVNLDPEEMIKLMEICGPEHVMFFLCDRFLFDRTTKKNKTTFEREVKTNFKSLLEGVKQLGQKIQDLEKIQEKEK